MSTPIPPAPQGTPEADQQDTSEETPEQETPKRSKRGLPRWAIAIIALVVVAAGVYAYNYFSSDAAQSAAGDCAAVTGSSSAPQYSEAACDAPEANFVVAKVLGSTTDKCGGDNYVEYTETADRGPDSKLCLMPNFVEGGCYTGSDDPATLHKADCTVPGSIKVDKVIKDTADESACPQDTGPFVIPEPKTTFCVAPTAE